ncbi:GntR family transcriptional regulator [Niveibacterium sp.]|uniref:GntR family transcriptional regulator n=1 Tax=Niveibacterium sp. TaxID=2017444 RepID=UPI0035AE7105
MSAAKQVYHALRQQILDMTLLPGTRIIERDIAAEHGTSRTPVHEAVQRLADEGLIEIAPRVGTFVARIPLDQIEEAMLVRTALEAAVVERAATRATSEGLARLRAILAEQHACVEANDTRGFHRTDEAFHEALADIAGFPGVWRLIVQAKTQVDRYRRLTLPMPGRMDGVVAEHEAVVAAMESGHAPQAVAAMRDHLDHVFPVVEIARNFRPDYFVNHLPAGQSGHDA